MKNLITKSLLASILITGATVQASEPTVSKFKSITNCGKPSGQCSVAMVISKVDPVCACPNPVGSGDPHTFSIAADKLAEFKAISTTKDMVASVLINASWQSSDKKVDFIESINKMHLGFKVLESGSFNLK